MAVGEFLLALVMALAGAVGSMVPLAAWGRTQEPRFLLVAGGELSLLALGFLWAYGQAVGNAPSYSHTSIAAVALGTLAAVLWLLSGMIPRRP
jgi:hypothetical protein